MTCKRIDLPALKTPDGATLEAYELKAAGLEVQVLSWGCYVSKISAPDARGEWKDIALGFDVPKDFAGYYDGRSQYYGCIVGRFGNRIAHGAFSLNEKTYSLAINNGPNHLHGGTKAWDKRNWEFRRTGVDSAGNPFVTLGLIDKDMEEGYPAKLDVEVKYSIVDTNSLGIEYNIKNLDAMSTVVNPTNHSYFNLSGDFTRTVYDHELHIAADYFTPTDSTSIPTGDLREVSGTPFDFTGVKTIGKEIDDKQDEQIKFGAGYDHNFVLRGIPTGYVGPSGQSVHLCAIVRESSSRRRMEVYTSEPGVQFYTANWLDVKRDVEGDKPLTGKGGLPLKNRTAFCLETQHFPDSPNKGRFPSTVLPGGCTLKSCTVYRFTVETSSKLSGASQTGLLLAAAIGGAVIATFFAQRGKGS